MDKASIVTYDVLRPSIFSLSCGYINNSLHLALEYVRILVCRHYLFPEVNTF